MALVALTQESLERLYAAFRDFCSHHRLTINGDKTHVMMVGSSSEQQTVVVGGPSFRRVHQFRYLGIEIDERA